MVVGSNLKKLSIVVFFTLSLFTLLLFTISDEHQEFLPKVEVKSSIGPNDKHHEFLPKVEVKSSIGPNDTMCYVITNPNGWPMRFYPKAACFPGGEYITYSEDSLYAWLQRQVTLQGEEAKLQMIDAIAYIIKSPRFDNNLIIYDHLNNTRHKKFSPIGWFSNYHAQCGDYMDYASNLLHNAYGIPMSERRQHTTPEHDLGEIMYEGRWMKVDFDPGTPSLMTPNPASPNGFASVDDIVADTSLLQESDRYLYADTLDLCPWSEMTEHRKHFIGDTRIHAATMESDFKIEGTWTLCAGCRLEWITPINTNLVYIDENSPEYQESYALLAQYQITRDTTYYLQAISILADYLDVIVEEAQNIIEQGLLTTEEVTLSSLIDHYDTLAPTGVLRIPPTTEILDISRNGDVYLPFLVTKVRTGGTVALLDTVIGPAGFEIELWNNNTAKITEAYPVQSSKLNFLTEGWIDSQNSETVITFAFNPGIYPIGQVDIGLYEVNVAGNLVVEANICNGEVDIINSTTTEDIGEIETLIYPNPTTGDFTISRDGVLINN
jgi:hypothetical protein